MPRWLFNIPINAFALWAAVHFVDGIEYRGDGVGLLVVALVFGLTNAVLRPLLVLLSLPALLFTLGLFLLVINAGMLWLTAQLASSFGLAFEVHGFLPALKGALVVSLVSWVLAAVFDRNQRPKVHVVRR